ncbi:GyrI-like domain-containing protein [Solitalea sp. MAHUQ-68]|uniref:GyrI-like domain-containing protein n=1 Tax=Solitalea agri TaxID=2953739 RepID=A0A9X2EZY5_9SPHI|nr:GyrI-like domain-containing protein [Solitalea agri]MCO4291585.1 GyrI-like domain-containing protein [Solitalea agri]
MSSQANYLLTHFSDFLFVGKSIRTSNETAETDIGNFWIQYIKEKWLNSVEYKTDEKVIGLYYNYEGDFTKPYTFAIGCKVDRIDNIPEGMISLNIPASNYAEFIAKGKMPECVIDTWVDIWNSDLDRTYTFDMEVYSPQSFNPENAHVEIFISVK